MLIDFRTLFPKYNVKSKGILHCGASYCQESDVYYEVGIDKVIWIEAVPEVYKQAKINMANCYPKHLVINACISDVDGVGVEFNISNNEAQSSSFLQLGVHEQIHPSVKYIDKIKCITTRLDTLLKDVDMSGINFINLDLQGAELLALRGLGKLINQFDYAYIEINKKYTYIGCPLVEDIDNFLSDFERVETAQWVADTWTDALYIRKTLL